VLCTISSVRYTDSLPIAVIEMLIDAWYMLNGSANQIHFLTIMYSENMTVVMLNGNANQIHFLTIMYSENMTVVILSVNANQIHFLTILYSENMTVVILI
jgi:hypothetical protein